MWKDICADARRNGPGLKGSLIAITSISFHVTFAYRCCRALRRAPAGAILRKPLEWYSRIISGCYLNDRAQIAGGLLLPHPVGVVIGEGVVLGRDCTVYQHVTLGSGAPGAASYPRLGDNVTIFANAVLIGAIDVGDGAIIGAGAIVNKNVPAQATAVGNPARIL